MSTEAGWGEPGPLQEVLARVVAGEGRNALTRVELAASELERFEISPGAGDRLAAIREAVGELEGVFARLDRLWSLRRGREVGAGSDLGAVWNALGRRLSAVLALRGVELVPLAGEPGPAIAMPPAALEAVLCRLVRMLVAGDTELRRLAISVAPRSGRVRVSFDAFDEAGRRCPVRLGRGARLDLELQLGEWQGGLVDPGEPTGDEPSGLGLELAATRESTHA